MLGVRGFCTDQWVKVHHMQY